MFVHESGTIGKPTIVFLHGNGANWSMWKSHMDRLDDYHCLAPDFPGYGQSNDQEWVSINETTKQIAEIIRDRGSGRRAHIVGLSLGGSITISLLSKAPDLVDHAIVDGAGVLPMMGVPLMKISFRLLQPFLHTDFVIKMIARMTKISEDDYAGFKQGMLLMSPSSFTRSFTEAISMRQPPGLNDVVNPVLFVSGEKDPEAVRQSNVMLSETMRNAQSRMIRGMGHGWLAEAPDLHCRMVRAWLNDDVLPEELIEVV